MAYERAHPTTGSPTSPRGSNEPPRGGVRPHPGRKATFRELAEEIEFLSSEGRPAHPEHGARHIGAAIAVFGAVVILSAILIGTMFDRVAGLGLVIIGMLMIAVNPAVWAGVLRARERERARRIIEGEEAEPPSPLPHNE